MTKILVISDSHGSVQAVENVVKNEQPDCLFFCGDCLSDIKGVKIKTYAVKGNCDLISSEVKFNVIDIEGVRFLITHGHEQGVKYSLDNLYAFTETMNCQVVCYGHTHIKNMQNIGNILFVNPGNFGSSRGDKQHFYAIITVNNKDFDVEFKTVD